MMCKLSELPAQSPVALQSQHLPVPYRHHIMEPMGNGIPSATSKDMRACLPSKSGDQRSKAVAVTSCELMHLSGKRHGCAGAHACYQIGCLQAQVTLTSWEAIHTGALVNSAAWSDDLFTPLKN